MVAISENLSECLGKNVETRAIEALLQCSSIISTTYRTTNQSVADMAHNCLYTALRAPRTPPVQLPLFLVPSFASSTAPTPHSRNYANHAKMPKNLPKNKRDPIADPNASRKHLKPDFPISTRKHNRDMNRKRGVSAMRSTGPRQPLSVSKWALPMPETDPEVLKQKRKDPQFDSRGRTANHGLWQFFYNKKSMAPPEEIGVHGREWTYAELSLKSFEDLHALYWVAHKEHNRIMTNSSERIRLHAGYGASEEETRENTVSTRENTSPIFIL